MDVVGLGQISLDRVVRVQEWPEPGGRHALATAPMARPGGQIATALLAAQRLGLAARCIGAVGEDAEGEAALAPLRAAGVDLAGVQRSDTPTRTAVVLVDDRDGERSVLGHRHPSLALDPARLSRDAVSGARVLLVDADDLDASRWAVAIARAEGIPSVLDVDRADAARVELARSVDFPIVSESFSVQLSGAGSGVETLAQLVSGSVRMAVVTRGRAGALARMGREVFSQPAFQTEVRDSTGAGDVFRGAFAWGLCLGGGAGQVLAGSAAAAALACTGDGAQGALPSAAEVKALARRPAG